MCLASFTIRKMKTKIALRFHLSPAERPRPRKQSTTNASKRVGKGPHSLLAELQTGAATLEISVENSQSQNQIYPKTQLDRAFAYAQKDKCHMRFNLQIPSPVFRYEDII